MSLHTVQPSYVLQKPSKVARAGGGDGLPVAPGDGPTADTVSLSDQGRMMSRLPSLIPPTPQSVRKLSAALANDLKILFRQGVVDARRGVDFAVDSHTGGVSVNAGRPDAAQITALIGGRPEIERQIHNIVALSRQVVASEEGADSRRASQVAQRAAQISAVVGDYASRFSDKNEPADFSLIAKPRGGSTAAGSRAMAQYAAVAGDLAATTNFSVVFNGADVQIKTNGKPWLSSAA